MDQSKNPRVLHIQYLPNQIDPLCYLFDKKLFIERYEHK